MEPKIIIKKSKIKWDILQKWQRNVFDNERNEAKYDLENNSK